MKNIEEIRNSTAKDFYYIGERLKIIREDLRKKDDLPNKQQSEFSATNMADKLDIQRSTMANIETRGSISANTFKLILYYYTLGYNPMWIIIHDNEFLPMQNLGENLIYQQEIQEKYKEMETTIINAMMGFKSDL